MTMPAAGAVRTPRSAGTRLIAVAAGAQVPVTVVLEDGAGGDGVGFRGDVAGAGEVWWVEVGEPGDDFCGW